MLRLLNDPEDVAHPEDTFGNPGREERFEGVHTLADPDITDGHAGRFADAENCSTAGVAVHLGEDRAGESDPFVEGAGDVHRLLTGRGIHNE